jgi:hypothetical protein
MGYNINGIVKVGQLSSISGSLQLNGSIQIMSGTFAVYTGSNDQPALQVNSQGTFIMGANRSVTPTPSEGAMFYDGSDYYLGFP